MKVKITKEEIEKQKIEAIQLILCLALRHTIKKYGKTRVREAVNLIINNLSKEFPYKERQSKYKSLKKI